MNENIKDIDYGNIYVLDKETNEYIKIGTFNSISEIEEQKEGNTNGS